MAPLGEASEVIIHLILFPSTPLLLRAIMLRINALSCHAYDTGFMNSVLTAVSVSRGRPAKAFDARKDRQEIAPGVRPGLNYQL